MQSTLFTNKNDEKILTKFRIACPEYHFIKVVGSGAYGIVVKVILLKSGS